MATVALMGSITLKYATAFTRTVTLSLVMMSWLGMSLVNVWRLTFTIRSMIGMMKNRPGPLAPITRPSRKITPRSYSLTMRIAEIATITMRTTAVPMPYNNAGFISLL